MKGPFFGSSTEKNPSHTVNSFDRKLRSVSSHEVVVIHNRNEMRWVVSQMRWVVSHSSPLGQLEDRKVPVFRKRDYGEAH